VGVSSSLFYSSNDSDKQTLYRRITPTQEQLEEQIGRWNELADHLIGDLKARSGYRISSRLQGSYQFRTQVRPPRKGDEYDIDLGINFEWTGQPESGAHDAPELMQMVQTSLDAFAKSGEGARGVTEPPKSCCCRIQYEGDFHIDVPSYHLDPNLDERTLATVNGWTISDPKAFYLWFKSAFDELTRSKVRRQIKYLKCWAALRWKIGGGRPSSVLLTVLVANAYARLSSEEAASEDGALTGVLREIHARLKRGGVVRNPVNPSENLNRLSDDEWSSFSEGLAQFLKTANEAVEAEDQVSAADVWSQAFAHFFPMPDVANRFIAESLAKSALPVPVMQPDVMVTAVSRDNRHIKFSSRNTVGPIPRNCDIYFELLEPWRLPSGAVVEWIVRNEGREAENTNDLGHRAGIGYTAKELSSYVGMHFMDCVLRLNGTTIGVRRIPVKITGNPVPPRNPAKQPAYAFLASRR
jgi:hypothetical protein